MSRSAPNRGLGRNSVCINDTPAPGARTPSSPERKQRCARSRAAARCRARGNLPGARGAQRWRPVDNDLDYQYQYAISARPRARRFHMGANAKAVLFCGALSAACGCHSSSSPATVVAETSLTIEASLALSPGTPPDGGIGAAADGDAGAPADGAAGADGGLSSMTPPIARLPITARDGATPVITDLWLYTLDGDHQTPLTGFTSTGARKSLRLMLPATLAGRPSGL